VSGSYFIGQQVVISVVFTVSGVATDPTTVTLLITDPNGTVTSVTPVHDSTGNYHYNFLTVTPGQHEYRWVGTGAVQAATDVTFVVNS